MINFFLKSVLLVAVLSVLPSVSLAQELDTTTFLNPEDVAGLETEYMKLQMNLDSSTATSVYDINLKYAKVNQEILKSDKSKVQKFKEIRSNSDAKDSEMKRILTNDQYNKYINNKKKMMKMIRDRINKKK